VGRRGKLGFDVDGVIYPWHEIVVKDMILTGDVPVDTTVRRFFLDIMPNLSTEIQQIIVNNSRYYIRPFLREGAKKVLNHLKSDWEIYYITSRPYEVESATRAWFRTMGLPNKENVYVVNGGKRPMVELLDLDVFVDDRTSHVEELHDICPVILVTHPWNEDYNEDNHVRVDQLHELIPLLEGGLDATNHNR